MTLIELRAAFEVAVEATTALKTFSSDFLSWVNSKHNEGLPILILLPPESTQPARGKSSYKEVYDIELYIGKLRGRAHDEDLFNIWVEIDGYFNTFKASLLAINGINGIMGDIAKTPVYELSGNGVAARKYSFSLETWAC